MNRFGRIFSIAIFGESHGAGVGILIDGCPSGISLNEDDFIEDLSRRSPGSTGTTSRKESDIPLLKSGIFNGITTGAPIIKSGIHRVPDIQILLLLQNSEDLMTTAAAVISREDLLPELLQQV